jgi:hypothetical protein
MKIEANGLGRRGAAFTFAARIVETNISETDEGDGLNLRPND